VPNKGAWFRAPATYSQIECMQGFQGSPNFPPCGSRWVSISEAARLLGISRDKARRGVLLGLIPSCDWTSHRAVSLDWIEKHTGKTQQEHYATQKGETN